MDTFQNGPQEIETTRRSSHESREGGVSREWAKTLLTLLIASFFGFVGGSLSPFLSRSLEERLDRVLSVSPSDSSEKTAQRVLSTDDEAITSLVEKNATSVVSIVISKDVPKVRNFYQSPFGGFPFFLDPFGSFDDGGNQNRGFSSGQTEKQKIGSGSGFLVSADGLVVTNKHVVSDDTAEYTVIMNDGKEYLAKVLARHPSNDIAILKIEGSDLPFVSLGDSDGVKVGQTVIAIGNPLGEFANSVTRGIVSGLKREVSASGSNFGELEQLSGIIQTDAAINPGNSGGPLFNISGEVIGVNVAMAQGAENIGFALPINQVKRVIEQVKSDGRIRTPYIGVRYLLVNEQIQKENNLPESYGALVLRGEKMTDFAVIPGSPADKAGIVENDIILEINGTKVTDKQPLAMLINQYEPDEEITLKVWHKGETKDIKVKLEERK